MEVYTKINTLYCRYQNIGKDKSIQIPNPQWKRFANCIIFGVFADPTFEYLYHNAFEAYSKIDGTNSKICYFPSTGEIKIGGKTDNASSQHGQFEMLQEIASRIKPMMAELYPAECARFVPVVDGNGKVIVNTTEDSISTVSMEESPIYIYGEYYGNGVQSGGGYSNGNRFAVFDINQQGWWLPSDMRSEICQKLNLEEVPRHSDMLLYEAEAMVAQGFKTHVKDVNNPDLIEEGLVLRPTTPLKDSRSKRIIVKVKHKDYNQLMTAINEVGFDEFMAFNEWYFNTIDTNARPHIVQEVMNNVRGLVSYTKDNTTA